MQRAGGRADARARDRHRRAQSGDHRPFRHGRRAHGRGAGDLCAGAAVVPRPPRGQLGALQPGPGRPARRPDRRGCLVCCLRHDRCTPCSPARPFPQQRRPHRNGRRPSGGAAARHHRSVRRYGSARGRKRMGLRARADILRPRHRSAVARGAGPAQRRAPCAERGHAPHHLRRLVDRHSVRRAVDALWRRPPAAAAARYLRGRRARARAAQRGSARGIDCLVAAGARRRAARARPAHRPLAVRPAQLRRRSRRFRPHDCGCSRARNTRPRLWCEPVHDAARDPWPAARPPCRHRGSGDRHPGCRPRRSRCGEPDRPFPQHPCPAHQTHRPPDAAPADRTRARYRARCLRPWRPSLWPSGTGDQSGARPRTCPDRPGLLHSAQHAASRPGAARPQRDHPAGSAGVVRLSRPEPGAEPRRRRPRRPSRLQPGSV
jgi:hypothetical protein